MEKSKNTKKVLKYTLLIPFLTVTAIIFALFSSFFIITHNEKLNAENFENSNNFSITIVDKDGNILEDQNKTTQINLSELRQETIDAFISMEDKSFFTNKGINTKRMLGALVQNIKNGKIVQGASTISQQLIKNTHLTNEKSLTRKLKEIKLTFDLEKNYSKNQILELL